MRKKSLVLVGICVLGLCGCGETTVDLMEDETIVYETEEDETTIYDTEEEITDEDEVSEQDRVIESDVSDSILDESDATLQLEHPNMKSAYEHFINFIEETEKSNGGMLGEIKYDLVYVTDDDIPELLVDYSGYWISLYTYVDNNVYPIMEQEPYGAWGRMYEYRDREGIIHSSCYSLEGDTEITYDELYKINDNYELEALYTNFDSLSQILFCPENEIKYYFDLNEISKEQYDEYLGSKYEILEGVYSAEEIKEHF